MPLEELASGYCHEEICFPAEQVYERSHHGDNVNASSCFSLVQFSQDPHFDHGSEIKTVSNRSVNKQKTAMLRGGLGYSVEHRVLENGLEIVRVEGCHCGHGLMAFS